jgi:prevent-host-death family protein
MINITKDIQSLTTFRRRSGEFVKQLQKSKRPVVLTVKGEAAAVVQYPEAYQRLLDIAAGADAEEGVRQGLGDVKRETSGRRGNSLESSKPSVAYRVDFTRRAERDLINL